MIVTKCRLLFLRYMPNKPTKWGIKVWACCDTITGYTCMYSIDVYTKVDYRSQKSSHGLACVVMNLLTT